MNRYYNCNFQSDRDRRDLEIEILKAGTMTENEAIRSLNRGTIVYDSLDDMISTSREAMADVEDSEEFCKELEKAMKEGRNYYDHEAIKYEGHTYYVEYVC